MVLYNRFVRKIRSGGTSLTFVRCLEKMLMKHYGVTLRDLKTTTESTETLL